MSYIVRLLGDHFVNIVGRVPIGFFFLVVGSQVRLIGRDLLG